MSMTISGKNTGYHGNSPITVRDTQCLAKYYEKSENYTDVKSENEGRESLNKKIHMYTGDITEFKVDAIVCSVQTLLTCKPYGIHSTVMQRAGEVYEETVKEVGYCKAGHAFITDGYDLYAKHIIHTAGPSPDTTMTYDDRKSCLMKSYLSCLDIVGKSHDIKSVAIPCLGCGGGGLELMDAINTGVTSIRQWLETDNNLTQVDSIILVMYNVRQWNEYIQELVKIFPDGKDLAGIDMETLTYADGQTMSSLVPPGMHSTNILCYQYNKHSVQLVSKHFHSLVNQLHKELGTRSKPPERFKNCGRIIAKSAKKIVVIYHGENSHTLEVQLSLRSSDHFKQNLCENVQSLINNYLSTKLGNLLEYKTYIRCDNSSWGDKDGLISTYQAQRKMLKSSSIHCRHRKSANNTKHSVDLNEITKFWIHQDQGSLPREPTEHNERAEESEGSLSSLSLSSVPNLQGTGNQGQNQGIAMVTRHFPCNPVEHFDDTQSRLSIDQSSITRHDLTGNAHNNRGDKLSSFQPFNDSLLTPKQCSSGRESKTNVYSRHQSSSSIEAWEPESSKQSECQAQRKSAKGNKHSRNSGACENTQRYTSTITGAVKNKPMNKEQQPVKSLSVKQRSGENTEDDSEDDKCTCSSRQERQTTRSCSSFSDLDLDSLVGACGGGSYGYQSEDSERYSNEMSSLNDQSLIQIARLVGNKDSQLGLELGVPYHIITRIKSSNTDDAVLQVYHILREWKIQQRGKASLETLKDAMILCSIDISTLNI